MPVFLTKTFSKSLYTTYTRLPDILTLFKIVRNEKKFCHNSMTEYVPKNDYQCPTIKSTGNLLLLYKFFYHSSKRKLTLGVEN